MSRDLRVSGYASVFNYSWLDWFPKANFWRLVEQDFLQAGCVSCCQTGNIEALKPVTCRLYNFLHECIDVLFVLTVQCLTACSTSAQCTLVRHSKVHIS